MISEALRLLRVYHDLNQKTLAEQLGISSSHVSEIEKGKKKPSMELIDKYAKLFKIPASSILFFSEQITDNPKSEVLNTRIKNAIASKIINFLTAFESRTEELDP